MSKTDEFENSFLGLIFNGTDIPDIAEDDTTSPATTLTVSLHTASPGEGGDMSNNEAQYTGYSRVTVVRTPSGWTLSGSTINPTKDIVFPVATGGGEILDSIGIGSGVGNNLMYIGSLNPSIVVMTGVTPRVTTASTITED